jgi:hypothetical protein
VRPDTVLRWHRDLLAGRHAAASRISTSFQQGPGSSQVRSQPSWVQSRPRRRPLRPRSPRRTTHPRPRHHHNRSYLTKIPAYFRLSGRTGHMRLATNQATT